MKNYNIAFNSRTTRPKTLGLSYTLVAPSWSTSKGRPFAPAKHHALASSPTMVSTTAKLEDAPLKTQSFRCRHSVQAPKMMREFNAFLTSLPTILETLHHQSSKLISVPRGAKALRPTHRRSTNQNYQAKTHEARRWLIVASS
jgi:hypothetical protein